MDPGTWKTVAQATNGAREASFAGTGRRLNLFREWGRQGGKKARWGGVSPEKRREAARNAALARWRKKS